jgi:uncharacterized protein (DUF302 family)
MGMARAARVMLAAPLTAFDLPLRVLVRVRDDGQTVIAFGMRVLQAAPNPHRSVSLSQHLD